MKRRTPKVAPTRESKMGQSPLPAPIDLAKLAAILEPKAPPAKAMQRAMEFFIEATYFLKECPRSAKELIRRFGSGERMRALYIVYDPTLLTDTLELDLSKFGHNADPAREYLSEQGLKWKTGRSVLNNWRLWQPRESKEGKEQIEMDIKSCLTAKGVYAIPRTTLQAIASDNKRRSAASKRKAGQTRRDGLKIKQSQNTGV